MALCCKMAALVTPFTIELISDSPLGKKKKTNTKNTSDLLLAVNVNFFGLSQGNIK